MTLQGIVDHFEVSQPVSQLDRACHHLVQKKHQLEVSMLSCGVSLLYSAYGMSKDKQQARLSST